jgi:DNA-binding MarR family transcriptional regulator
LQEAEVEQAMMNGGETGVAQAVQRLEELVGYNLRRASALMMSDFSAMFADTFVRPTSFSVACIIDEQPGITSAEICRILGLQRANIVTLLAELEAANAIRRVDDADDKRIQRLYMSESGKENLLTWRQMAGHHEDRVLKRLTAGERAQLMELLNKIWRGPQNDDAGG